MPEPSLDGCQQKFPRAYEKVDLAPHPVVGLVFPVEDGEKFPQALGLESLAPFLRVCKQLGSMFHGHKAEL